MHLAHSKNTRGEAQTLADHLWNVATLAGQFGSAFGAAGQGRLAGLLHDLGKYGDLLQQRLRGEVAVKDLRDVALAVASQGHHVGLQSLDPRLPEGP